MGAIALLLLRHSLYTESNYTHARMVPMQIPENGLLLQGAPHLSSTDTVVGSDTPAQIMRLDLASGVLEEIMRASRMGKDIHMSFGKNIVR